MVKINFRQLVEEISKQHNIPKSDVRKTFDGLVERFRKLKEPGDVLYLKNIGAFKITERQPKKISLNNKEQTLPKRRVVIFEKASSVKPIKCED